MTKSVFNSIAHMRRNSLTPEETFLVEALRAAKKLGFAHARVLQLVDWTYDKDGIAETRRIKARND